MTTRQSGVAVVTASILLLCGFFLAEDTAYAQFGNFGAGARIFLSVNPEHPGPNERAHISIESALSDLSQSDIVWYVNNKVLVKGVGVKDADILVGPLGSKTGVSVTAQTPDGTIISGNTTISPAEVDLLWESDSYVPPFYRGRALASPGTSIRMHAIARFKPAGSAQPPESAVVYTWKLNGAVVQSASGKARSTALFPSPALFGTDIIEVTVSNGTQYGSASAQIASTEPQLFLYEDHPLFGIMYNQALGNTTPISDIEATFAAIPYFAEADSPDDARLLYSWSVNRNEIPSDELKRSELTVNASKSSGLAQIALSIAHAANLAMSARGSWGVIFSTDENGFSGIDPFGMQEQ
ncbi:MAG: hypothetical protein NUV88_01995 [Candidatus Kaiserbacteria bacterium]|nr:hypothetical protein [Candidatus Kaiserbacteria bacterium]